MGFDHLFQDHNPEGAMNESERRFRLVADAAPVLIWESGVDKLCTYFNKRWLEFTGRPIEKELGNGWADGVHPDDLSKCWETYTQSFDRREQFDTEYRLRRHDGVYRRVFDIGAPRFEPDGSFAGYIGSCIDVTDRRFAEEALRKSDERFRLAAEAGKMFAYEWDAATDAIVRSGDCFPILGIDEHTPTSGAQVMSKIHPEDKERVLAALAELSPEKPQLHLSYRMIRPDGAVIWVDRNSRASFDEHRGLLRVVGMVADITERKRAEDSLRLFRTLIDESNDAIEVVDPETLRFLDVNEKSCRELGYSRDQLLTMSVPDIDPALDDALVRQLQNELARSGYVLFERVHRRKDGSTYPVEINLKHVEVDRSYAVNVVRDITERKRDEEALRQKSAALTEAQRLARIGSWQWETAADAVTWSDELYRIAGREPGLPPLSHREHAQFFTLESWERLQHVLQETVRTATPYELDLEMVRGDGTTRWVTARGEAQRDSSGQVVRLSGTVQDITERKRAEEALASVSRRLIEAQELERARIARELHDDIGQRLALMAVELEQLRETPPNSPAKITSLMDELWKRTYEMATDVQYLSHELHSSKLEYLGMAVAMRGFCKEFSEQQNVEIDFKTHDLPSPLSPEISLCVFRVLQEALHNSAKHSGVRRFEVKSWGTSGEVHLTVSDSGSGFDSQAAREGRGLGLVSMQERVKLLNGTLSIESEPNRGTIIHARVPVRPGNDLLRAAS